MLPELNAQSLVFCANEYSADNVSSTNCRVSGCSFPSIMFIVDFGRWFIHE